MVGRWDCEVPLQVEGVLQTVVDVETLIEIGFQNSSEARRVSVWGWQVKPVLCAIAWVLSTRLRLGSRNNPELFRQ